MTDQTYCISWVITTIIACAGGFIGQAAGMQAALAPDQESALVITEILSNPDIKTERVEFVEVQNTANGELDLSGCRFTGGIGYTFPTGTILGPGQSIAVAEDPQQVTAKWTSPHIRSSAGLVLGPYQGKLASEGERIRLYSADGVLLDEVDYGLGFPWPIVGDAVDGQGHSLQLLNVYSDNDLGGTWRSAIPTPGRVNSMAYTENLAPIIRQVRHRPQQPMSEQVVTISAKITDSDGVAGVSLSYHRVDPGNYFTANDSRLTNKWITVTMLDNGLAGDEQMGDHVYSAQLPSAVQQHRGLVRYKIEAVDTLMQAVQVPYADDPQPNFAYFVYDGVPAWQGSVQPGGTAIEFGTEVMSQVPIYHLLAKKSDVEAATWLDHDGSNLFRRKGTLVYNGQVYDNIRFRMRGGVWRYAMGKNMWKFDFNRGHAFQAHDDYGRPYTTRWDKLNLSACIQQGSFGQRGEQGMFEALSFRLFNMAGVPAPETNWMQLRIIDEPHESGELNAAHPPLTSKGTQYDGDFWGLYMTIEQMDGRFLDEHGLPDGNLYKMDNGNDQLNNQGPTQVSNGSDLRDFQRLYQGNPSTQWWGSNVDLNAYYSYYAVYQAIHHGDITGKNWYLFHSPFLSTNQWGTSERWWQLPWDTDLTWTTYYGSNNPSDPFRRAGVLNQAVIAVENRNRVREFCDLLFNPDQMNQLIDEYAGFINDADGGLSMVDADRAMWDTHWVVGSGAYPTYLNRPASQKAGQGRFYEEAAQQGNVRSFEGMVQVMKDYVAERLSHMRGLYQDAAIPNTPVVVSTAPAPFPSNNLTFTVSPFSDPQGNHSFAALQWRMAEVAPESRVDAGIAAPGVSGTILIAESDTWRYMKGIMEPSEPGLWREANFDDSHWPRGTLPIGYGESFVNTPLADMRNHYSTVYVRRYFEVTDLDQINRLSLDVKYDDGIVVWINGQRVLQENVSDAELSFQATANSALENKSFVPIVLTDPSSFLQEGHNLIAIHLLNSSRSSSSDCFLDVRLTAQKTPKADDPDTDPIPTQQTRVPYEIDALWQSEVIGSFEHTTRIPASVITSGHTYRVRCRMQDNTKRWSHWSTPVQFVAGEPLAEGVVADLRVTELMAHPGPVPSSSPYDSEAFEFVELKNIGDEVLDITSVSFTKGIAFDFTNSAVTVLPPGDYVLVVKDRQAFESRYGQSVSDRIAGQYTGSLANEGERLRLEDVWGGLILQLVYDRGPGWPLTADGLGHSLVPLDVALISHSQGALNYGGNWRASTTGGGSPGYDDPNPNELMVLTLNEFSADPGPGQTDWVELLNQTDQPISLADWYLSDNKTNLRNWPLPKGETVAPHTRLTIELTGKINFALSKRGESLYLSYYPPLEFGTVVDAIQFGPQVQGISTGRYPDGGAYWFPMLPSKGRANTLPTTEVQIHEIMYHPLDPNLEYIELANLGNESVALGSHTGGWRLDGAISLTFPPDTVLANQPILVVGFDPLIDPTLWERFLSEYTIEPSTVQILGPWQGNLSNAGERLVLEHAIGRNTTDNEWILVDEVIYSDVPPWPPAADGQGQALIRSQSEPGFSGLNPNNWSAGPPTPGRK
jgi:hypothetical protein